MERESVQVILCDQRMPETSGVAFLKEVRERWPDVVRIIISGYTETEDIIAGINDAGIYQYILKPWHPNTLMLTIRAAVQLYDLQQQSQRLHLELRTTEPVLRQRVDVKREKLQDYYEFSRITRAAASPLKRVAWPCHPLRQRTCRTRIRYRELRGDDRYFAGIRTFWS
jgi:two-component system response regulator HupR/HoxA